MRQIEKTFHTGSLIIRLEKAPTSNQTPGNGLLYNSTHDTSYPENIAHTSFATSVDKAFRVLLYSL
jgi:hypothetical protein